MGQPLRLAAWAAQGKPVQTAVSQLSKATFEYFRLLLLCAVGVALIIVASALDARGVRVPGNGLRWMYLFGSVATGTGIWNVLVWSVYTILELRYFLRLVMLPSAQLLFKVWLNVVAAYVAFEQLFCEASVGGEPPKPLSRLEGWVRRLLLCALLFTCVCVAVTAGCNAVVAVLYSEQSRQKIVAAMQHAYVMYRLVQAKLLDEFEKNVGDGGEGTAVVAAVPSVSASAVAAAAAVAVGGRQQLLQEQPQPTHPDGDARVRRLCGVASGSGGGLSAFARQQRRRRRRSLRASKIAHGGKERAHPQYHGPRHQHPPQQLHALQHQPGSRPRRLSCRFGAEEPMELRHSASSSAAAAPATAAAAAVAATVDDTVSPQRLQATPSFAAVPSCTSFEVTMPPPPFAAVASCNGNGNVVGAAAVTASARNTHRISSLGMRLDQATSGDAAAALRRSEANPLFDPLTRRNAEPVSYSDSETYSEGGESCLSVGRRSTDISALAAGGPRPMVDRRGRGRGSGCCSLGIWALSEGPVSSGPSASVAVAADVADGAGGSPRRLSDQSLNGAMQGIEDMDKVHVRRTLMAALEVIDWLKEQHQRTDSVRGGTSTLSAANPAGGSHRVGRTSSRRAMLGSAVSAPRPGSAPAAMGPHHAARMELHAWRESGLRRFISPRWLLDEMLAVYGSLSDLEIPVLAGFFQQAVWDCVGLKEGKTIKPEDFMHIFPHEADRKIAWDALDGDKDGQLTGADVHAAVVSFLQQERSMALTVRAVRRLTWSLQSSLVAILNGIFLVAVYLHILDVARFFNGGSGSKTSIDVFSVYVLVVSLIFSEQIKTVLLGCVLILTQQPFDVGEELVIEESPGWRVMGIVQDFNLFFLRVKKSTDGELVTLPLNRLASGRFTNLTRSDWKIEQNYFAVDASTPPAILAAITEAARTVINNNRSEYDELYGFLAVYHGFEKPNKVVIRTFHRYKFNLSAPHKRIANARHGIMSVVRETFDKMGVEFTELRMHASLPAGGLSYPPGATAAAAHAAAIAASVAAAEAAGHGSVGAQPSAAMPAALDERLAGTDLWRSDSGRGGAGCVHAAAAGGWGTRV